MSYVNQSIVSKIIGAVKSEQKVEANAQAKTDKLIQQHIDAMRVTMGKTPMAAFLKGNAATNEAKREVKELFEEVAKILNKGESAARNYATSYWIAFEQNVPFQRSLFTSKAKPEAKSKSDKSAGAVKSTTREALDKTLTKAMQQARLLGLTEFAAEVLDLCIESLDGFKEVE